MKEPIAATTNEIAQRVREPAVQASFAKRITDYMQSKNYKLDKNPGEVNIVYVEGANEDGSTNDNKSNQFNDRRVAIVFKDGVPAIAGNWEATVNPGVAYMGDNQKGLPHTLFGQYSSWQVGTHVGPSGKNGHEGLLQSAPIKVVRAWTGARPSNAEIERGTTFDGKKTFIESGEFGINQHWGYDYSADDISIASAGCLVGRTIEGHKDFMQIIKADPRYRKDSGFMFTTAIIPSWELSK